MKGRGEQHIPSLKKRNQRAWKELRRETALVYLNTEFCVNQASLRIAIDETNHYFDSIRDLATEEIRNLKLSLQAVITSRSFLFLERIGDYAKNICEMGYLKTGKIVSETI